MYEKKDRLLDSKTEIAGDNCLVAGVSRISHEGQSLLLVIHAGIRQGGKAGYSAGDWQWRSGHGIVAPGFGADMMSKSDLQAERDRMIELADLTDLTAHLAGDKKMVVFFEMTGCPYCVAYRQRVDDLVAERPDLNFARVKLDDPGNPLWEQYAIHAVPTFLAFEKGVIVARADSILALGLSKKKWLEFRALL